MEAREMAERFRLDGSLISCTKFGPGHINETYLLVTNRPHLYIMQNVNTSIFPDPVGLMNNIILVTEHIRRKDPDPRHVLTLVPTLTGEMYILPGNNRLWRVYEYVTGGICMNLAETADDFRQSAVAFGTFQRQLSDFAADRLTEVIPKFHDTPNRYRNLREAIRRDAAGRLKSVRPEVDFYLEREESAGLLTGMLAKGELPLRVTHNDTKLNNVMLDEKTREPMCIMDLDTVMPGLAAYDFGDSIRFGASTAEEDERDLSKVSMSMALYAAYTDGFLSACGSGLTPAEKESLPAGARLMTLECGARFLTDYLDGDVYFHTERPEHNLDRARTQMVLVKDMEANMDEMIRLAVR